MSAAVSEEVYTSQVCGMLPALSKWLKTFKGERDSLLQLLAHVSSILGASESTVLSVGISYGSVFKTTCHVSTLARAPESELEDVWIKLVPDPVWIDCKQQTNVRKALGVARVKAILKATYKLGPPPHCAGDAATVAADT